MLFEATPSQDEEVNNWIKNHNCKVKKTAIGGRISYVFTPTGLGVLLEVKCLCSKTLRPKTNYGDL